MPEVYRYVSGTYSDLLVYIYKNDTSQSIIINKLSIDVKPELDQQGGVVYLPNPERKPYLITDNHRDSPVVLVSKSVPPKESI